jgi:hypothetical protein
MDKIDFKKMRKAVSKNKLWRIYEISVEKIVVDKFQY